MLLRDSLCRLIAVICAHERLTRILDRVQQGDPKAAEELLPLVYEELRKLAAHKMAHQSPGHTLQPTALVHEAWLRLAGGVEDRQWNNRRHFFTAAAQTMRHILVDAARRKRRAKHGGTAERVDVDQFDLAAPMHDESLLALEEALQQLETTDAEKARVVILKFFGGLTHEEVAQSLGVTERTVERHWAYAKVWLLHQMQLQR
jgi:RNA polymerase sigma factor (TIGR02999 family)